MKHTGSWFSTWDEKNASVLSDANSRPLLQICPAATEKNQDQINGARQELRRSTYSQTQLWTMRLIYLQKTSPDQRTNLRQDGDSMLQVPFVLRHGIRPPNKAPSEYLGSTSRGIVLRNTAHVRNRSLEKSDSMCFSSTTHR